jgi:hypothetical protein
MMKRKTFNLIASVAAFAFGAIYLFSDSASITANVIGASGSNAGFASIIGIVMIISSMVLFEVSMTNTDTHSLDLERLVRATKNHEVIYAKNSNEEHVELHRSQPEHKEDHKK